MVRGNTETAVGSSRDWAEANARDWLQRRGFDDVGVTSASEHPGAAIKGTDVMAQVKFSSQPVSGDEVDKLSALMIATGRTKGFFFCVAGYTDEAMAHAEQAGIVLLKFSLDAKPVNEAAKRWLNPGTVPTASAEHLQPGDRLVDADGGDRVVDRVHTRRVGKMLHFIVSFQDGGDIELEMGQKVKLHPPGH